MLSAIETGLERGLVIPYLGPGVLALARDGASVPASPEDLVGHLTTMATVPHKIRNNLTAAAQYIENFKHRKTVVAAMAQGLRPSDRAERAASLARARPHLPLLVHAWYDDLPQKALRRPQQLGHRPRRVASRTFRLLGELFPSRRIEGAEEGLRAGRIGRKAAGRSAARKRSPGTRCSISRSAR